MKEKNTTLHDSRNVRQHRNVLIPVNNNNNNTTSAPVAQITKRIIYHKKNKSSTTTTISTTSKLKMTRIRSSVDYFACCGAGHRLSKLVDANYLAKQLGFQLRVFFGFCQKQEVYSWLFGYNTMEDSSQVQASLSSFPATNLNLVVRNDVPGFFKLIRTGQTNHNKKKMNYPSLEDSNLNSHSNSSSSLTDNNSNKHNDDECPCPKDRLEEDVKFFTNLRTQFRGKQTVENFMEQHDFGRHTVIGMHVRAGNGEVGDFTGKNRSIYNYSQWTMSMAEQLIQLSQSHFLFVNNNSTSNDKPPLLFLATDTASMVTTFRELLVGKMKVLDLSQNRPDQGQGVFFGENFHNQLKIGGGDGGSENYKNDPCLQGWEDAFTDMMILSHSDVVIAARPSSFTQSLPMTLVLGKTPKRKRKVLKSYCEVNPTATAMQCFEDLMDWCCNGTTSFSLSDMQRYDYRRMPNMSYFQSHELKDKIAERPQDRRYCIPTPKNPQRKCLPYDMPDKDHVEKEGSIVGYTLKTSTPN